MNNKDKHLTLVDIKDVDLSKLEDDKNYICLHKIYGIGAYTASGLEFLYKLNKITHIYLPSSTIEDKEEITEDKKRKILIDFLVDIDECYGMHEKPEAEKCVDRYLSLTGSDKQEKGGEK